MKKVVLLLAATLLFFSKSVLLAQQESAMTEKMSLQLTKPSDTEITLPTDSYIVGIGDVLDITVLQPEQIANTCVVSPDGAINFPYIGHVQVSGMGISAIQDLIRDMLADGYMKYPVVSVSLVENRSKRFYVYGEVMKPGTYLISDNTTVLKSISMAGGFTKFGSSSRVKILRPKKDGTGYETIKVNLNAAMGGSGSEDVVLQAEDMVVVSEGVF